MKFPIAAAAALLIVHPVHAAVFAHYSFDVDFTDSSGNGRNGSLIDTGTTGNSGIVSTAGDYVFGAGGMSFSADRDYIDVPLASFGSGLSYTIAFWARKTAGDTGQAANWDMVIGDRSGTNFFIGLNDLAGSEGLRWRGFSNAAERQQDFAIDTLGDYDWHHYAIVASGTTISLYLDGEVFGSFGGKLTGFQYNSLGEGYPNSADFDFHGQIDELWIFDEALDAPSLGNLMNFNSLVPEPSVALLSAAGALALLRRRRDAI